MIASGERKAHRSIKIAAARSCFFSGLLKGGLERSRFEGFAGGEKAQQCIQNSPGQSRVDFRRKRLHVGLAIDLKSLIRNVGEKVRSFGEKSHRIQSPRSERGSASFLQERSETAGEILGVQASLLLHPMRVQRGHFLEIVDPSRFTHPRQLEETHQIFARKPLFFAGRMPALQSQHVQHAFGKKNRAIEARRPWRRRIVWKASSGRDPK